MVVARHAFHPYRVHRQPLLHHPLNWRTPSCFLDTIAANKILALIRHAMLHCHAPHRAPRSLSDSSRFGFRMINEPSQSVNRNVSMHSFKDVQETDHRLVIRCMNSHGPLRRSQSPNDRFSSASITGRRSGARLQEVFKVGPHSRPGSRLHHSLLRNHCHRRALSC